MYNFFGQLVIVLVIQVGGLGYMTFGSFVILASKGRVSDSRISVGKVVFSMADGIGRVGVVSMGLAVLKPTSENGKINPSPERDIVI